MGRHKKYTEGTKIISLSIDLDVHKDVERLSKEHGKSVSAFLNDIIRTVVHNDFEYASMMAKKHYREFYFWKGEKERLKQ